MNAGMSITSINSQELWKSLTDTGTVNIGSCKTADVGNGKHETSDETVTSGALLCM
jgi:hypothetical protein